MKRLFTNTISTLLLCFALAGCTASAHGVTPPAAGSCCGKGGCCGECCTDGCCSGKSCCGKVCCGTSAGGTCPVDEPGTGRRERPGHDH